MTSLFLGLATLAATSTTAAAAPAGDPAPETAPFRELDRVEGAWIDLVFAPVRPMAVDPASGHVYAVNSHDSTVVEFDAAGDLVRTVRVPWGPVSLALWDPPWNRQSPFLLVVCKGSYTLAYLQLGSGRIEHLLDLPTEPPTSWCTPRPGTPS